MAPSTVVTVSWVAMGVIWSVAGLASPGSRGEKGRGSSLLMYGAAAIVAIYIERFRPVHLPNTGGQLATAGMVLTVAGIGVAIWSRLCLGGSWRTLPEPGLRHHLVTSGPYSVVRHPIYSAVILAMIGTGLCVGGIAWFGVAVLAPVFVWRAVKEERLLQAEYPGEYGPYKARTKALIPFVW